MNGLLSDLIGYGAMLLYILMVFVLPLVTLILVIRGLFFDNQTCLLFGGIGIVVCFTVFVLVHNIIDFLQG